ncbi:MAG: tetratricopeptide repeat protein [Phycisphaerae bacterium]
MSQLLEILGKGLVGSLWCVFGQRLEAFKADTKVLKIHLSERPNDPDLLLKAAVSFYRQGVTEQALDYAQKLTDQGSDVLEGKLILCCILERLGRREDAIEVLERLVRENAETDTCIHFALGFLYETNRNEQKAMHYYEKTLKFTPNLVNGHQRLAAIHFHHHELGEAIKHYQALCEIDPEDIQSRILLAGLYLNNGYEKKAVAEYQIALTIEPENWETENEIVRAYIKSGEIGKAIETLESLLEKQGEFPDTYLQLAELHAKLGQDDQAVSSYKKALEIHPGYLEAMVKFGTYHLRMGRYLPAAEWFSRAIDVNDRLLNAYVGLSVAQYHTGLQDKASETIELAAAIEPNTTMLFAEVARLELKASAARQAKEYLEPQTDNRTVAKQLLDIQTERFAYALESHPQRADWHYRFGLLLKAQGKVAQAAVEFRLAVDINPDYVKAMVKLGLALYELNKKDEAQKYFERAVILEPGFADVHYQLGLIYSDQARYPMAVEEFEQSLRRNGQNIDALAALAQALENIGMHDRAKTSWQSIIELAPESEQAKLAKASLS